MARNSPVKEHQMATAPRIREHPLSVSPRPDNTSTSARRTDYNLRTQVHRGGIRSQTKATTARLFRPSSFVFRRWHGCYAYLVGTWTTDRFMVGSSPGRRHVWETQDIPV